MFFLKYLTWSSASRGQNLLLKFKKTCTSAEQSIPLKDLPPHLYLIFLKEVIFLKGFFSIYDIGLTSFLFTHPFANFKNFELLSITLILDPKVISFFFTLLGNLKIFAFKEITLCVGLKKKSIFYLICNLYNYLL